MAHDWGAVIGWLLAGQHGERFYSFTALSVGHPAAYIAEGWEQKRKAWYTVFFQLRGITEAILKTRNWLLLRKLLNYHPEMERWIEDLSRPGRLTASLNWYRANLWELYSADFRSVSIPVMGIWSSDDIALAEDQMINSKQFVDNSFRYERVDDCSHWIPLDKPQDVARLLLDFFEQQETQK